MSVAPRPPEDRFWPKVDKTASCWNWTGSLCKTGYGRFRLGSASSPVVNAHRFSFELAHGPIADGLTVDHLCRNRRCVNPAHLEAVTLKENTLRGIAPPAVNAFKTVCDRGHPLSGSNLYVWRGERHCRICKREAWRRWYARQQGGAQ